MQALVRGGIDEFQILDPVVGLVLVDVVNLHPCGDRAIRSLPLDVVSQTKATVEYPAQVSLFGYVTTVRSARFRISFAHAVP